MAEENKAFGIRKPKIHAVRLKEATFVVDTDVGEAEVVVRFKSTVPVLNITIE